MANRWPALGYWISTLGSVGCGASAGAQAPQAAPPPPDATMTIEQPEQQPAAAHEAMVQIGYIAVRVIVNFESRAERPTRFDPYRAVPSAVPGKDGYMSTTADWESWATLEYSLEGKQLYQYEVEATADGQKARVIARGDPEGDGVINELWLSLEMGIDPDGAIVIVAPNIETNQAK